MKISAAKLRELLVTPGHIPAEDFEDALKESSTTGKTLVEILVARELVKEDQLWHLVADAFGVKFVDFSERTIDHHVLQLIPEIVARHQHVIAFGRDRDRVSVGMLDPTDHETLHFIEKRTAQEVVPYLTTPSSFRHALANYKTNLEGDFQVLIEQLADSSLSTEQHDRIVIKMVNLILEYGYYNQASDVHIEPFEKKVIVRFRIHGIMHPVLEIPKNLHGSIARRIKILSDMRIDEYRAAQDGKIRFQVTGESVDVRVSVLPITEGENIVMRILSSHNRQLGLKDLGLADSDFEKVHNAIERPHGMILTTGPSGAGKTTTLYAILKILNRPEVHISTIEDPVEYDLEGISQIQVNPETNLTFAEGLRAIVRQDPDIIMVGEIRDQETASIAVNSALTGHLVLSTLHTNDAPTALPRLIEMGIEPFLIASTVNTIIAQRLVRKLCADCRSSQLLPKDETVIIQKIPRIMEILSEKGHPDLQKLRVYHSPGCIHCANTGYSSRVGIFEVLEVSNRIKEMIVARKHSTEIMAIARKEGMRTMLEDGIEKVLAGLTTLSEVVRVTRE